VTHGRWGEGGREGEEGGREREREGGVIFTPSADPLVGENGFGDPPSPPPDGEPAHPLPLLPLFHPTNFTVTA